MLSALRGLVAWLGGWSRVALLFLALAGLGAGILWEQQRHPPVPPGATQVVSALNVDTRQTTYWHAGTAAELLAFYRRELPPRGWTYCGNQGTPGCTNLIQLIDRPPEAIDVYRRSDDLERRGPTIEVWPIEAENGQTYVTVYETRGG